MPARNRAGRAFWGLVALAGLTGAGLLALLAWRLPLVFHSAWLACLDALSSLREPLPAIGLALPMLLLALGVARGTGSLLVQLRQTRRLVAQLTPQRVAMGPDLATLAAELGLDQSLELVDDPAPYTFTQGLARPRVWLSTALVDLLEPAELQAVLRHERHHLRQRDPLRVLLSRSLAHSLFFVPLAGTLRDAYLLDKEMDADAASGADEPLAGALLKLLRSGSPLPAAASLAAIGPVNATAARVQRLLAGQGEASSGIRYRVPLWISAALVLALLGTVYVSTSRAAAPPVGGECGYVPSHEMPVTPVLQPEISSELGFTPVSLTLR
jgi:beta-lactamase regulating signal transducer with metallopeptidase domain